MRIEIRRLTLTLTGLPGQGAPLVPVDTVARKDSAEAPTTRWPYARAGLEAEALANEKLVQAGRMATVAASGRGPMLQPRGLGMRRNEPPTIADRIVSFLTAEAKGRLPLRLPVMGLNELVQLVRNSVPGADLLGESALRQIIEDWREERRSGAPDPGGPARREPTPLGERLSDLARLLDRIPTGVALGDPQVVQLNAGLGGLRLSHERPGLKLSAGIGWDRALGAEATAGDLKFTASADVLGGEGRTLTFGLQYGPDAPDLARLPQTFQGAGAGAGHALVNLPRLVSYLREDGVDELKTIPDAAEQARRIAGERDRRIPVTLGLTAEVNRRDSGPPGVSVMGNLTFAWDVLKKAKAGGAPAGPSPTAAVTIPRGAGQALDAGVQEKLEGFFGRGLPDVRVHTGPAAEAAAAGLGAEAFTLDRDIYFGAGKFDPGSRRGLGLLGHELTHVLQQDKGRAMGVRRAGGDTGSLEHEAEAAARAVQAASSTVRTGALLIGAYRRTYRPADGRPLTEAERTTLDLVATSGREACRRILQAEHPSMLERNRTLPSLRMTFDVDLAAADTEATAQAWGRKMAETIVSASERAGGSATQSLPAAAVSVAAAAQGTIQRSLKFEFQTGNHVWAVKNSGTPDPRLLPRKYAPTTKGYREGAGEERGDKPAYLSVGREGGPARKRGHVAFVEAEGPLVMEEAKKGVDTTKAAQFIKEYRFKRTVNVSDLIGERVRRRQLMLVSETDNAKVPAMAGLFNPNTFELRYSNKDGTRLDVHLSEGRRFKAGHIKLMKVGRGERSDIDKKKPAQHIEIWKVTEDANGPVDFLDKRARVELVSRVDNAKDRTMKGLFNPNTWEKNYFSAADFTGSVLSASAKPLDVHMDADGRLQPGRVKFMVKKKLKEAKEQTAIELQSESTGALEFETPKWFREWPELKDRIQEAVDMTKAIDAQVGTAREVTDATILSVMDARKNTGVLGKVVEWPAAFSTAHLKNLRKDKRRLLVQIADPTWRATVQASEAIALSEYESLLKEHERVTDPARWRFTSVKDIVIPNANSIFAAAFAAAKLKDSTLDESLFADLKGFLQLVVTYIVRGQLVAAADEPAKFTFRLMARTNFGSMFKELLSAKEQALFKTIVGNAKRSSDNLLLKELEAPINAERTKIGPPPGLPPQALTRRTRFFFRPVGRDKKTSGPTIHDWLVGITKGKDLLSGSDFSGAMGAKSVETKPGDKDFRRAQFEIRGTVSHGGHVQPAVHWVSYAEHIFDAAARRSADTPDDPTTPKVSEASKTGLKK